MTKKIPFRLRSIAQAIRKEDLPIIVFAGILAITSYIWKERVYQKPIKYHQKIQENALETKIIPSSNISQEIPYFTNSFFHSNYHSSSY
ncbi:MAG: hypothetical protein AABX11_00130 [Nanoarchaeota archaeon]